MPAAVQQCNDTNNDKKTLPYSAIEFQHHYKLSVNHNIHRHITIIASTPLPPHVLSAAQNNCRPVCSNHAKQQSPLVIRLFMHG
jgi:hypothetical protein